MGIQYDRTARELYEMARARNGKDRADIAARIADKAEEFLREAMAENGLKAPNGDAAENLVMALFSYVMEQGKAGEKPPQKSFAFRASYQTRSGNMGGATFTLKAGDISEALELGIARVEKRKSYSGKMSADICEIKP